MKSFAIIISGLAFASVAKAALCSASNAEVVTVNTGSNGGGGSGGGGTGGGGSGGGSGGGGGGGLGSTWNGCIDPETFESLCGDIEYRRLAFKRSGMTLSKRAVLDCTSTEACISLNSEIICYNPTTDDFHIEDGSKGNFRTGDYILPDGQRGNYYSGPNPTLSSSLSAGVSRSTVRSSSVASSTTSVSTTDAADATTSSTLADSTTKSSNPATASPASATTSSISATTTPNSANQMRGRGPFVGAVVGMAGLLAL